MPRKTDLLSAKKVLVSEQNSSPRAGNPYFLYVFLSCHTQLGPWRGPIIHIYAVEIRGTSERVARVGAVHRRKSRDVILGGVRMSHCAMEVR